MGTARHSRPDDGPAFPAPRPRPRARPATDATTEGTTDATPDPFRILFVCTGNVHRSPMARSCLLALVRPAAPLVVESAGTQASTGAPMAESSRAALAELRVPAAPHAATLLRPELVERADLVLTAEESQARDILAETPRALRRTFTLLEFVRVSAGVAPLPPGRTVDELRAQVLAVAGQRGLAPRATGPEDIIDPVRARQRQMTAVASAVLDCVRHVVTTFGLQAEGSVGRRLRPG